jgi:cell wall-associated NlpC family hydrolase
VGVYLGHNEFAQASGSRGVTISKLDDPYWTDRYRTARRLTVKK